MNPNQWASMFMCWLRTQAVTGVCLWWCVFVCSSQRDSCCPCRPCVRSSYQTGHSVFMCVDSRQHTMPLSIYPQIQTEGKVIRRQVQGRVRHRAAEKMQLEISAEQKCRSCLPSCTLPHIVSEPFWLTFFSGTWKETFSSIFGEEMHEQSTKHLLLCSSESQTGLEWHEGE